MLVELWSTPSTIVVFVVFVVRINERHGCNYSAPCQWADGGEGLLIPTRGYLYQPKL